MAKVQHWVSLEQGFSDPSNRVRPHWQWHIEFSHSLLDLLIYQMFSFVYTRICSYF
jgi:hypothetical protein